MVYRGVASSALHNKAMYQTSLMANALAQFMVSQGYDANDTDAVSVFNGKLVELFSKFKPQMVDVSIYSGQHEANELLATFTYNPRIILSTYSHLSDTTAFHVFNRTAFYTSGGQNIGVKIVGNKLYIASSINVSATIHPDLVVFFNVERTV